MESFRIINPIVIASIFTSLSFIYQNVTGLIYLMFLLVSIGIRYFVMSGTRIANSLAPQQGHQSRQSGPGPGPEPEFLNGLSTFVFTYTFGYVFLPMFIHYDINIPLLVGYITFFIVDTSISIKTNPEMLSSIILNFFGGAALGIGFCVFMIYALNAQNALFFNEISASKDMCSLKSKQSFKCAVAK